MNYSRQREIILNILKESRAHPTAEEILCEVKKHDPLVARGTVYRNLKQLVGSGEILRLVTPSGTCRYDYLHFAHSHAVCNRCGRVIDVSPLEGIDGAVHPSGFEPASAVVFGRCENCKKCD